MDNTSVATTPAERQASLVPTALIAVAFLAVAIAFVTSSSSWYLAFKTVHVGFAVIWIGGGALLTVLGLRAELSRNPQSWRRSLAPRRSPASGSSRPRASSSC